MIPYVSTKQQSHSIGGAPVEARHRSALDFSVRELDLVTSVRDRLVKYGCMMQASVAGAPLCVSAAGRLQQPTILLDAVEVTMIVSMAAWALVRQAMLNPIAQQRQRISWTD